MDCYTLYKELLKSAGKIWKIIHPLVSYRIGDDLVPKDLKESFNDQFKELYYKSSEENFYWEHCTSNVYKNNFDNIEEEFLKKFFEASNIDFIKEEKGKLDFITISKSNLSKKAKHMYDWGYCFGSELIGLSFSIQDSNNHNTNYFIPLNFLLEQTILENIIYSKKRKMEFLDNKLIKYEQALKNDHDFKEREETVDYSDNQNPHPRIFKDSFSFFLFEKLIKGIDDQNKLVDCSFIYRQMQKDNYINEYIGEKEFRDFLFKDYEIEIDEQLKTFNKIGFTRKRSNHYKDCIELTKNKTAIK